mmetsp:Transcript_16909/g.24459  ORF Transcript_16909/g.24459 Transcript_16909/m.24459 type:complete len:89 (-) Transcript_16909:1903-2169(-)
MRTLIQSVNILSCATRLSGSPDNGSSDCICCKPVDFYDVSVRLHSDVWSSETWSSETRSINQISPKPNSEASKEKRRTTSESPDSQMP